MIEVILLIILAVVMIGIFIFLYSQGYMVSKSISAVTFIGSAKENSARFSSCYGYMKRVIKFKEEGTYTFSPSMAFAVEGFFLSTIDKLSLQRYNDNKQRTIVRAIPQLCKIVF